MCEYDPNTDPDPSQWGSLDDDEKLLIVQQYHERYDAELPDVALHSLVHTVVENQVALGDETPVANTLDRLKCEGLNRHEAIHAIASVFVTYIHEILNGPDHKGHTEKYYEALNEFTVESWYSQDGGVI